MGDENSFPFDPELVSATPNDFKAQMEYIANHFSPITFRDLLKHLDNGQPLPRRPIIITFDDGHADNYTHAFPILRSLDIPATIFLSTSYIDSDKVFWFDHVAYLIFRTKAKFLSINHDDFRLEIRHGVTGRRLAREQTLSYLKSLPNTVRLKCLEEIKHQLGANISPQDKEKSSALSWEQVYEMNKNGIEFGSHSVTHPILSKLDDNELYYEIDHSKKEIERRLNETIDTIAYPVGGKTEFSSRVVKQCMNTGYKIGITYISGVEKLPIDNLFQIKRLHVTRFTTLDYFKAMLALPMLFK